MPLTIEQFKEKYPAYKDWNNQELAEKIHAKYYSNIPKEEFFQKINFNPIVNKHQDFLSQAKNIAQLANNQVLGEPLPEGHSLLNPLKDIAIGLGTAGQNISNLLPGGNKPQVDFRELTNLKGETGTDKFIQGMAEYAPFQAAGGPLLSGISKAAGYLPDAAKITGALSKFPELLKSVLSGTAYGASQPENPGSSALFNGAMNAILHGGGKALENLAPSQLFRGKLSPEELAKNMEAAKGTNTPLGDVVQSRLLKTIYDKFLKPTPFSGAQEALDSTVGQINQKVENVISDLKGKNNPDTALSDIKESLIKEAEKQKKIKNKLYEPVNTITNDIGLKVELPNFAKTAKKYAGELDESILSNPKSEQAKLFNRLKNYSEPYEKEVSKILSPNGGTVKKIIYPKFVEANSLKGDLASLAEDYSNSSIASERRMGRIYSELANSLKKDTHDLIKNSGNEELKNAYQAAEKNYAQVYSKFLDKDIQKHLDQNSDSDIILRDFVKSSAKQDRANILLKLLEKLPTDKQRLLGHNYLSEAIDKQGKISIPQFNSLVDALGKKQFNTLFNDEAIRKNILNIQKLSELNSKAIKQAESTHNPVYFGAPSALSSIAGGMVGGPLGGVLGAVAPSVGANYITSQLTNEKIREALIKKMLENKKSKINTIVPQYLLRGTTNQFGGN